MHFQHIYSPRYKPLQGFHILQLVEIRLTQCYMNKKLHIHCTEAVQQPR